MPFECYFKLLQIMFLGLSVLFSVGAATQKAGFCYHTIWVEKVLQIRRELPGGVLVKE